ncbi:MAG: hypothetical protein DWH81_01440 [Planctomycetota bacterium]|nr:MAG: hypothetical protein DWH81_01440 [Planctomycetota bacterium]
MAKVSTACIQTRKITQKTCGQECVEWAIGLLEDGHDSHYLRLLIGMSPPFNHFEVASYRDGLLKELGFNKFDPAAWICEYSREQMQKVLKGELDLIETLQEVSFLHESNGYIRGIQNFYLLLIAYEELNELSQQWTWPGATLENIHSIIQAEMKKYVDSHRQGWNKP